MVEESETVDMASESSSEENSDGDLEELEQKIAALKKEVKENKYYYDGHVALITALREAGELEQLRQARENMNTVYPLSPELWLNWISDERKVCSTEEERGYIMKLFDRAVHEYTSVKIWLEYIMFMLGCGDASKTEDIMDQALTNVGIHVAEGTLVWQAVLLVEQQRYANLVSASNGGEENKEACDQKKKIQSILRRYTRVPLMNIDKEEFLALLNQWFDGNIDKTITSEFEKSEAKLEENIPFEDELIRASDDEAKLAAYRLYIEHTKHKDSPAAVQSLFERAITDLCLNADLWEDYVRFVMNQFSSADFVVMPVCERSQRNCPWSAALCQLHIESLQHFAHIHDAENLQQKIRGAIERSLCYGAIEAVAAVKIWMAYLVFLRRQIGWEGDHVQQLEEFRKACSEALELIDSVYGRDGDLQCTIPRYQSRVEAELAHNMEGARSIWNDIIFKRNNNDKNPDLWLEFINLERAYGDQKHARKLFRRALERIWDDVEKIGAAFEKFEQEVGTFETASDFSKRYQSRLSIVLKMRSEKAAKEEIKKFRERQAAMPTKSYIAISPVKLSASKSAAFSPPQKQQGQDDDSVFKVPAPVDKVPTKALVVKKAFEPPHHHTSQAEYSKQAMMPSPGFSKDISPPPGYKRKLEDEEESESSPTKKLKVNPEHGKFVKHNPLDDPQTVFLSNLDYSSESSKIIPIFEGCGDIDELRLVRDFKGRSKGFGYLVFKSREAVTKALALDRTKIDNRPVFVSRCNSEKRMPVFKYSTGLEKDKVYVRGLPKTLNESDVRKLFEPHAQIKEIRLVTFRNGMSKGLCYITYHSSADAGKVIQVMDKQVIDGKKIQVMISNPSAPRDKEREESTIDSAVTIPVANAPPTTQRPKLSFVPRSLQQKRNASETNGTNGAAADKPMSNADFRKFLHK